MDYLVTIYKNLLKLCTYRNIIPDESHESSDQQILQDLIHYEYIMITGKRDNIVCVIFLIIPDSKYATKSGEFRRLLKMILPNTEEIMFVSGTTFNTHIKRQMEQYKSDNPKIYMEDHGYDKF